jgi:L-lactate dehydrogenase complex protein LldE
MAERVALFVPCLAEHFDARAVEATARLIRHLGLDLAYPAAQTCCGQPFRTNGDLAAAAALARRMDEVFAGYDLVVTPSASCAAMVRRHYPTLAGPLAISRRVVELAELLVARGFDPATASWPGVATYHPSCHGRDLAPGIEGTEPPALALLSRVRDLSLRPLPCASQCCGFGGTFATRFAAVSVALGEDKLALAAATGAHTLIADDAGCRLHLRGLPSGLEVKHLAEILAEGLHLMARPPRRSPAPTISAEPAP